MDGIAPLIFEMRAKASEVFTELGKVRADFAKTATETEASAKKTGAAMAKAGEDTHAAASKSKSGMDLMAGAGKAMAIGIVGAGVTVGGAALKMGMDFQESMTTLVTGAGESEKNIGMVGNGILNMAGKVGQSSSDLASGMYLVESAGYHAGDGLKVLQAAAEGAKVGNADMKTVADGVTTALTDYGLKASDAASVTSKLVTTVASGKTTMGDLAGSLSNVLPTAKGAKVGLDQVLGAMATMTGQGISADQASQNLANTIRSLSAPSQVASKAMAQIGLNSTDVAAQLGKKGLTGTLDEVYTAIMQHMGPSGLVLQSSFNQSKLAAQSAKDMIGQLPASLQKMAQGYLDGTVTQKQWTSELKGQPATIANLGKQFATVAKQATGFSDQLKSGSGSAQTFNAVLSQVMGGATGMNTALALTGGNMDTFKANVAGIGKASAESDGSVKGFAETQKDLKTKLTNAKDGAEAMVTSLGMHLIPVVTKVLGVATSFGNWLTGHKAVLYTIAGIIGTVVVVAIGAWIAKLAVATAQHIASFAKMIASTVEWAAKSAVQFATWTANAARMMAAWVAEQASSIAETVSLWAMYFAEWIAKQATALAQNVARMVAGMAQWVAAQAVGFAQAAAAGAVWIAEHIAMAAEAVVQYGIMAAAATAAFIAENAATLGIGVAIAAVVAGVVWLATHWQEAWHAICTAAQWAYDNVIKPVGSWIMDNVLRPIGSVLSWLYNNIWKPTWDAIGTALKWGYDHVIAPVIGAITGAINGIVGAISTVIGWIQKAIDWFSHLFDSANNASGAAQKAAANGAAAAKVASTNFSGSLIGSNLTSNYGPSKDVGGWIYEAPKGKPIRMTGHGGEYVLSLDMLAGRQKIDPAVVAAIAGQQQAAPSPSQQALTGQTATAGQSVTVIAQTNASPQAIASQVGWTLRAMA